MKKNKVQIGLKFLKRERLPDGRLLIEGTATSEALDSHNSILEYEGSKAAVAKWRGNVREQHARKAVGRSIEVQYDDEARAILVKAFVSKGAQDTQEKIMDGTLTGFSIGGLITDSVMEKAADGREIERVKAWRMDELSIVDEPSNPDCAGLTLVRAAHVDDAIDDEEETEEKDDPKDDEKEKTEKAAAAAAGKPLDRHHPAYGTDLDDLSDALSILRSLAWLRSAEAAEGEASTNDVAIIDKAIAAMREFVGEEAAELAMPAAEEIALARSAPRAGVARIVRQLLERAAAPATTPAPVPVDLAPITQATAETEGRLSKAIGELDTRLKAIAESVDVIARQPVPGGPALRDNSSVSRRTLGEPADVAVLRDLLSREQSPEIASQLQVRLNRALAAVQS